LEVSIRFVGEYDEDGQFKFKRYIRPYVLPANSLENQIKDFHEIEKPYLVPDILLGWKIASNSVNSNKYYSSNSIGIRSNREYEVEKNDGVVRIAIFGDSFIHSDDVPFEQTLGYHLERKLSKEVKTEVMNFGVGGYGNDQAYLRWKHIGRNYNPDIVLIGFQAEMVH
jgi:hypothetical protein